MLRKILKRASSISEISKKETAAALYKEEEVSLAKAASIACVSLIRMKEILMEKGILEEFP